MLGKSQYLLGPADLMVKLSSWLLPLSVRLKLGSLKARAEFEVPKNEALVLLEDEKLASLFSNFDSTEIVSRSDLTIPSSVQVSLISTVRNALSEDRSSIAKFFSGLEAQSLVPEEVVICDGGSSDGTWEALKEWEARELPFKLVLLRAEGANIASGRNLAIETASKEVIACTDFGCQLTSDWLQRITEPFSYESKVGLSMGYYEPVVNSWFAQAILPFNLPRLTDIEPSRFLPSARSLALKKSLWRRAGGFPEYLSYAGEDSLFAFFLKYQAEKVAFVPESIVSWHMPAGFKSISKTLFRYASGDAEGGYLFWRHYLWASYQVLAVGFEFTLALVAALFSWFTLACVLGVFALFRVGLCVAAYSPLSHKKAVISDKDLESDQGSIDISAFALWVGAFTSFFCQGLGFIFGVLKRSEVSTRKKKNLGALRPMVLDIGDLREGNHEKALDSVKRELDSSKFVALLEPLDKVLDFHHPHVEHFKKGHFSEDVWLKSFS